MNYAAMNYALILCEYTCAHCHPFGNGVSSAHLFTTNGNMNRNVLVICSFAGAQKYMHMPDIFQVPIWCIETPDETVPMLFDSWKSFRYILGVNEKTKKSP